MNEKDTQYMVKWHITISDTALCPLSGLTMRDVMNAPSYSSGLYRDGVHEKLMSHSCCYADAEVFAEAFLNPNEKWWGAQDGVSVDWVRIYKVEMVNEVKGIEYGQD